MAIALTSNDISTRGINNTNLAQFAGRARQVVININDGYRPIVMDGSTIGGKFKCASVAEVNSVESSLNTKINSTNTNVTNLTSKITNIETAIGDLGSLEDIMTETQADAKYLAKSANAASASKLATARTITLTGNATGSTTFDGSDNVTINVTVTSASSAGSATKATQDASGNIITSTYATKTELSSSLGAKLDTYTANSTFATKTELSRGLGAKLDTSTANSTFATKTELGNKIDTSTANSTFATKTEVTQGLSSKLDSTTAARTYATKAQVPTITTGTTDLTAGSSSLATGAYHFVYE